MTAFILRKSEHKHNVLSDFGTRWWPAGKGRLYYTVFQHILDLSIQTLTFCGINMIESLFNGHSITNINIIKCVRPGVSPNKLGKIQINWSQLGMCQPNGPAAGSNCAVPQNFLSNHAAKCTQPHLLIPQWTSGILLHGRTNSANGTHYVNQTDVSFKHGLKPISFWPAHQLWTVCEETHWSRSDFMEVPCPSIQGR